MSVIGCSHDRASQREREAGQSRLVVDESLGEPRVKTGDKVVRKRSTRHVLTWEEVSAEVTTERTLRSGFGLEVVTASRPALVTAPFLPRATLQDPRAKNIPAAATNVSHGTTTDGRIVVSVSHSWRVVEFSFASGVFFAETFVEVFGLFRSFVFFGTKKLSFKGSQKRDSPIPPTVGWASNSATPDTHTPVSSSALPNRLGTPVDSPACAFVDESFFFGVV